MAAAIDRADGCSGGGMVRKAQGRDAATLRRHELRAHTRRGRMWAVGEGAAAARSSAVGDAMMMLA
jgi:hypothetical protein